jgi:hypothetical protein
MCNAVGLLDCLLIVSRSACCVSLLTVLFRLCAWKEEKA